MNPAAWAQESLELLNVTCAVDWYLPVPTSGLTELFNLVATAFEDEAEHTQSLPNYIFESKSIIEIIEIIIEIR